MYIRNTRSDIHQLEMQREKLRSEIEEEEDQLSQEDVTSYECVIQECEEKLSDLLKQKEEMKDLVKKKVEESRKQLQTLRAFDADTQELVAKVQQLKEKLEVCL